MKIAIINGPNLNLIGTREPGMYGTSSFADYLSRLKNMFPQATFDFFQSNIEGELIDKIQQFGTTHNGIVLNAGGYTHTSVSIADAVAAITTPVVEVHISNIFAREDFRHVSYVGAKCAGTISGFGLAGYRMAVDYLLKLN
jgi:3-dehydroquinate dehydratase-2